MKRHTLLKLYCKHLCNEWCNHPEKHQWDKALTKCYQKNCPFWKNNDIAFSSTRIYKIWQGMKARCSNQNTPSYIYYGSRGITVCKEWNESFHAFYNDMKDGYKATLTLDRIDNNGNYEPSNCRWATQMEQHNNKRSNTIIEYDSQRHTVAQWARKLNMNEDTLKTRLYKLKWTSDKALSEPVKKVGRGAIT